MHRLSTPFSGFLVVNSSAEGGGELSTPFSGFPVDNMREAEQGEAFNSLFGILLYKNNIR